MTKSNWTVEQHMEFIDKNYIVHADGYVTSKISGEIIKPQLINSGYLIVHLCNKVRRAYTVHRLVAMYHVPNPHDLPQVNHEDGNKHHNWASNLSRSTQSANMKHAFASGLTKKTREKAAARMSLIGKAYAKQNGDRLRIFANDTSKPVLQLDLQGNVIAEFPSVKAARRETGSQNINKVIAGKQHQSKGFKWKFKYAS